MKQFIQLLAGLLICQACVLKAQSNERRPSREKSEEVSVQAIIESVDVETREVVLRGARGRLVTLRVDDNTRIKVQKSSISKMAKK